MSVSVPLALMQRTIVPQLVSRRLMNGWDGMGMHLESPIPYHQRGADENDDDDEKKLMMKKQNKEDLK